MSDFNFADNVHEFSCWMRINTSANEFRQSGLEGSFDKYNLELEITENGISSDSPRMKPYLP